MAVEVTDEQLYAVVEAASSFPTKQAAADALGLPRKTFTNRLEIAVRRNLTGDALGGDVPEGFELTKITRLSKTEGGRVMEWSHLNRRKEQAENLAEVIAERLNALVVPVISTAKVQPSSLNPNLVTFYPIPDFHLGQYSWGKENGGQSYDLDIAKEIIIKTFQKLVEAAPPSDTAVIVVLGDYYHADGPDNRTPKSGNALDVDSRYTKVVTLGAEIAASLVGMALQKHFRVKFKALPGNHDPHGGDTLTLAMWMRFLEDPRVEVDRTPGLFWFYQWGSTMTAWHHGHETKPEAMPGVMAAYEPDMWGQTQFRYAFLGHQHKFRKGGYVQLGDERGGAQWEVFQAITAKDAWNRGAGHASGRSITSITIDKVTGVRDDHKEPI